MIRNWANKYGERFTDYHYELGGQPACSRFLGTLTEAECDALLTTMRTAAARVVYVDLVSRGPHK